MFLLPIVLTHGFSSSVTPGQVIQKGEVLATRTSVSAYVLNIAEIFGVSLRKAKSCVRKQPGESVRRGDTLAQKPGILGMSGERIVSEVNGVVYQYEAATGALIIQTEFAGKEQGNDTLISPIDGVISICDIEKIVIQTEYPVIVATHGSGHVRSGELHVMSPMHTQEVDYFHLDATVTGKVILGGQLTRDALVKAMGMNVLGIITAHIADEDLSYIQQKYTLPVLVVHEIDYESLSKHGGKHIYIDGLSKSIVV